MKQHFVATVTVEYSTNIIISQKKRITFLARLKARKIIDRTRGFEYDRMLQASRGY